jgi:hypothetical protein
MARAPAAAGTTKGPAPLPATLHAPAFIRLEHDELQSLLNKLRSPLALHTYMLLLTQMRYTDGEFLGGYARLIELMTPPAPERGRRRDGPTYKQVRTAVADLIAVGLVQRGDTNEEQGQLRLFMTPRGAPKAKPLKPAKQPKTAPQTPTKKAPDGAKNPSGAFARPAN